MCKLCFKAWSCEDSGQCKTEIMYNSTILSHGLFVNMFIRSDLVSVYVYGATIFRYYKLTSGIKSLGSLSWLQQITLFTILLLRCRHCSTNSIIKHLFQPFLCKGRTL